MKHTPLIQACSAESQDLLSHVLSFFETLLLSTPEGASPPTSSRRGRPRTLSQPHLWLACLLGLLTQAQSLSSIWHLLVLRPVGSFAPVAISSDAVRRRLLSAKLTGVLALLEQVNRALLARPLPAPALQAASFAREIYALDESTLDALARLCQDTQHLSKGSPLLPVGKLVGLFNLRTQSWSRVQFRSDALAHCSFGAFLLLEAVPKGSLILADLGYFGFAWFDLLTDQGLWWISRLKAPCSYRIIHTIYQQGDILDALVWLGAYRSDQAAHAVRLVQFRVGPTLYQYLTNVHDPRQLPLAEIAALYARRWDIELAFKVLKEHLQLRIWWACDQVLVLQQLILSLIIAQVLHRIQMEVALQAQVDPFDVSIQRLLTVLTSAQWPCPQGLIASLVEHAHLITLIRPHTRRRIEAPLIDPERLHLPPPHLVLRRRFRHRPDKKPRHPRTTSPFDFRFAPRFLI